MSIGVKCYHIVYNMIILNVDYDHIDVDTVRYQNNFVTIMR
jgi:hypothetical protein